MKSEKKTSSRAREIISQIIFYLLLALILFSAAFLAFRGKQSRPTFVFDRTFLWVETESMEPTIDGRSYVMVKKYKGEKIGVGNIIVFECPDESSPIYGSLIIHRVIEVTDEGYRTKGDNEKSLADTWTVAPEGVVALWRGNLGLLTFFGRVLSSPVGFAAVCALFLAISSAIYLPSVIKTMKEDSEKKKADEHDEEIMRRVRLEVERMENENKNSDGNGKSQ